MGARRGEGKGEDVHDLRGEANPKNAFSLSAKLPVSSETAMTLLWVEPTGYAMAQSGWMTARLKAGDDFDIATMTGWIDRSYRAVAPKTLVKALI